MTGAGYVYWVTTRYSDGYAIRSENLPVIAGLRAGLGAVAHDMVYDSARERLYVSLPVRNTLLILQVPSLQEEARLNLGYGPRGLDLSSDGSTLFCALERFGGVGLVDMNTLNVSLIGAAGQLGDLAAWDCLEPCSGYVVVGADARQDDFAYIVAIGIDFEQGHRIGRLADHRPIGHMPLLALSYDREDMFVGDQSFYGKLYRLNIVAVSGSVEQESSPWEFSCAGGLCASPDGRLFLGSGQVVDADQFVTVGSIAAGIPALSNDGSVCYVANDLSPAPSTVKLFSTDTYAKVQESDLPSGARCMLLMEDVGLLAVATSDSSVYLLELPTVD